MLIMANEKVGHGNGNERNARRNLPSWMGSKDKTDPAQDEVTNISSVKGGKSSSNVSKFNKKSAAQGETATKIDASCFSKLLKGAVFVLSGFVNPERSMLRSQALEMGAEYRPDWDSTCTLLVCAFPNTPKFRQVANDCGTIVSKDWVVDCYNQKKLVEIDSYLMNAGKPWRKTYLENSASHAASETVQRTPTTEVAASPISKGETSRKDFIASSKVKELAFEDLKDTISWLQNQEETPEASEVEKIAAGGIIACLQDVIDAFKENQEVDHVVGDWKFVPRVVRELQKCKEKVGTDAVLRQELYEHALTCKHIYEKEFERVEKSEPARKKLKKDVQIDGNEDYDSEKTEIMTDDEGSDSDATVELNEEELKVVHDKILAKHSKNL
ncbi:DNA-repair protein XRCC1 isoform X2 [Nymphaea colorata]|nr:DNA-repair protein XRCC1 isoform X2 [Nymphaea colorata]XP_031488769.1 DNA-repair protein XRCC1 isoform X2 [Nymphaea colorata]XP_031488771.1 DNA-repair protein XRCC1 isoform X2 [Nymphaea colorata]XP_031488772.1 DNA-repair protein XRCC1 isoform X2 [Nymphaea colorata]